MGEEQRRHLPAGMSDYANDSSEEFIQDNDAQGSIFLKLLRLENISLVKKLVDSPLESLKQKITLNINIGSTFEKN